jgi:hypothetical protein
MMDLVREIRRLAKSIEGVDQRRSRTLITGTVHAVRGATVKVKLGEDEDGKPLISPWLKMPAPTGKRGGGVSRFTKLGVGDSVVVLSPSGELGPTSGVAPWTDTEQDPSPGAAETDGEVVSIGDAKLEVRDGCAAISVGRSMIEIMDGRVRLLCGSVGITLTADGAIFASAPELFKVSGAELRHNAKNVGDTHGHSSAPPGSPGPPI